MGNNPLKFFSESQVQVVIDKILEALGFKPLSDIERGKPIKVKMGTRLTTIFADKVVSIKIKNKRTALMIVEGKRPDKDLDEALEQGISYAKNYDPNYLVPYVLVSDGKILEIFRSVPKRKLLTLDITENDVKEIDRGISSKKLLQKYRQLLDFTKEHLEEYEPETPEVDLTGIPHIKTTRAKNFELLFQQVQIMIFEQLRQVFFLRQSLISRDA